MLLTAKKWTLRIAEGELKLWTDTTWLSQSVCTTPIKRFYLKNHSRIQPWRVASNHCKLMSPFWVLMLNYWTKVWFWTSQSKNGNTKAWSSSNGKKLTLMRKSWNRRLRICGLMFLRNWKRPVATLKTFIWKTWSTMVLNVIEFMQTCGLCVGWVSPETREVSSGHNWSPYPWWSNKCAHPLYQQPQKEDQPLVVMHNELWSMWTSTRNSNLTWKTSKEVIFLWWRLKKLKTPKRSSSHWWQTTWTTMRSKLLITPGY